MRRARTPPVSPVERAVLALETLGVCRPAEPGLVGVSGGRDSMVLLHALYRAGYVHLVVCHLHHGIRGAAADQDATFVREQALALGLAVEVARADVPAEAAQAKISLETAARSARQGFFARVAREHGCQNVFLAHHADDQVETVLFNLCRGAGGRGLAGMSLRSEWSSADEAGDPLGVIRPLLGVWRREIDAYVHAHALAYREDASNTDPAHTRNRLRHEILPALNAVFGRDTARNIWRAADILGAQEAFLHAHLRAGEEWAANTIQLPWPTLAAYSVAEQRLLLRTWLRARGCHGTGHREVEAVRALLDSTREPAKVNLPGGRFVRRRQGVLFVEDGE